MNYLKRTLAALLFLVFGCATSLYPIMAQAAEEGGAQTDIAGATGFTYSVNFPENQMGKDIGYYHLKMKPTDKQVLSIAVSNPGKEKVTIGVSLNGAKTNQNGVIEYGDSPIKEDPSLKYDFKKIVTGPEKVELAAGETKNVELTVQMPEGSYDGVIAGGVQLMKENQDKANDSSKGSKIINQYAYVVGILLQESDKELTPDLNLNSVTAKQSNYRNAIFVDFSNVVATYLNDMSVEVQITGKNSESVLYERKQTAMRMAPNSFLSFPVSMNGEKMVPGDYTAKILVTSGEHKWAWDKEFKITDEDANKYNERDVGLVQEKGIDWKLIAFIVGGVILLIVVLSSIFIVLRKRKAKKEREKKKLAKKKKKKS